MVPVSTTPALEEESATTPGSSNVPLTSTRSQIEVVSTCETREEWQERERLRQTAEVERIQRENGVEALLQQMPHFLRYLEMAQATNDLRIERNVEMRIQRSEEEVVAIRREQAAISEQLSRLEAAAAARRRQ